jgi:hypothetical protein
MVSPLRISNQNSALIYLFFYAYYRLYPSFRFSYPKNIFFLTLGLQIVKVLTTSPELEVPKLPALIYTLSKERATITPALKFSYHIYFSPVLFGDALLSCPII